MSQKQNLSLPSVFLEAKGEEIGIQRFVYHDHDGYRPRSGSFQIWPDLASIEIENTETGKVRVLYNPKLAESVRKQIADKGAGPPFIVPFGEWEKNPRLSGEDFSRPAGPES